MTYFSALDDVASALLGDAVVPPLRGPLVEVLTQLCEVGHNSQVEDH